MEEFPGRLPDLVGGEVDGGEVFHVEEVGAEVLRLAQDHNVRQKWNHVVRRYAHIRTYFM